MMLFVMLPAREQTSFVVVLQANVLDVQNKKGVYDLHITIWFFLGMGMLVTNAE